MPGSCTAWVPAVGCGPRGCVQDRPPRPPACPPSSRPHDGRFLCFDIKRSRILPFLVIFCAPVWAHSRLHARVPGGADWSFVAGSRPVGRCVPARPPQPPAGGLCVPSCHLQPRVHLPVCSGGRCGRIRPHPEFSSLHLVQLSIRVDLGLSWFVFCSPQFFLSVSISSEILLILPFIFFPHYVASLALPFMLL